MGFNKGKGKAERGIWAGQGICFHSHKGFSGIINKIL